MRQDHTKASRMNQPANGKMFVGIINRKNTARGTTLVKGCQLHNKQRHVTHVQWAHAHLDLVPAFVEAHGHGANERLHPGGGLVVGGPEPPAHVFVVQHLHFERKVLLQVLDDHHQERQLDAQRALRVCEDMKLKEAVKKKTLERKKSGRGGRERNKERAGTN